MEADDSAINVPAIAAAHVIKRYVAQAPDEISLEVLCNKLCFLLRGLVPCACTYYRQKYLSMDQGNKAIQYIV